MLIDSRKIGTNARIRADTCIIGAGAAGITIARELSKTQENVVLLESGGFDFDARVQSLYEGDNDGRQCAPLDVSRLRYFGGTTNHYGGACRTLDKIDFESRDWLPGGGWPIEYGDLAPYYAKAEELFPRCTYGFDKVTWIRGTGFPPICADSDRIETKIWQFNPVRFGSAYRDELLNSPRVSVYLHANAIRFEAEDARRGRIRRLHCGSLKGPPFSVDAGVFILCCGGIENARLLLIAKDDGDLTFDEGDVLGRYFMDHIVVPNAALFTPLPNRLTPRDLYVPAGLNGHWFRGALGFQDDFARQARLQNVVFFVEQALKPTGREALSEIWSSVSHGVLPDRFGDALGRVFSGVGDRIDQVYRETFNTSSGIFDSLHPFVSSRIEAFIEQAPNRHSRVSLSDKRDALGQRRARLTWRLSESDKHSLLTGLKVLGSELARAGIARVRINVTSDLSEWPSNLTTFCHHMGTTRMDHDRRYGVVNENCRVHGIENLYVGGSSVFPSVGSAAPTLTIVALAIRLADYLKREAA